MERRLTKVKRQILTIARRLNKLKQCAWFLWGGKSKYFGNSINPVSIMTVIAMSRSSMVCLVLALLGVVLFLIGSNIYNELLGWSGIALIFASVIGEALASVYPNIRKRGK